MPMPADMRAECLAVASATLAEEIHSMHLPGDVAGRVFSLVEQIERHAQALGGKVASFQTPAPASSSFGSNVIPLRPRRRKA